MVLTVFIFAAVFHLGIFCVARPFLSVLCAVVVLGAGGFRLNSILSFVWKLFGLKLVYALLHRSFHGPTVFPNSFFFSRPLLPAL